MRYGNAWLDTLLSQVERLHRPPVWVELLSSYGSVRFGYLLLTLPRTSATACTTDVLSELMTETRAGEAFVMLGVLGIASTILDVPWMKLVVAVLALIGWGIYTHIREDCLQVPADGLYERQVLAMTVITLYVGARLLRIRLRDPA